MNRRAEAAEADLVRHREGEFADQIAGVGGDDRRTDNVIGALAHVHPHKALVFAIEDGAVDLRERLGKRVDRDTLRGGFGGGETDVRDFRRGVGGPRNRERGRAAAALEEGVLNHEARHEIGGVGELVARADVATGEDRRVVRLEAFVHGHALGAERDAGRFEAEIFDVRGAADGDEELVGDAGLLGSAGGEVPANAFGVARDIQVFAVAENVHAVAFEGGAQNRGGVAVFARQEAGGGFDERHRRAEARERLRHLAADGAGPDDGEAAGQHGEREERLVGQIRHVGETGDGRGGGAGAGGDRGFGEAERLAADLDRGAAGEFSVADKDIDAEFAEARGGIVGTEVGAEPAHALHHGGKIDGHVARELHAEARTGAGLGRGAGGADERFRGHAADIQAIAAEQMAFDERDFGAEAGGARGGDEAGGAAADDDEVVTRSGGGVDPIRRVNVGVQAAVVRIPGLQRRGVVHGRAAVRWARAARARRVTNRVTTRVATRPTP